jgi:hypothetical protein
LLLYLSIGPLSFIVHPSSSIQSKMSESTSPNQAKQPAPGETSLATLLSTLTTTLHPSTYVFINLPLTTSLSSLPPWDKIQLLFRETSSFTNSHSSDGGLTLVTTLETAISHGYQYSFPCKMITLNVQSSLEAVGFMAVIATRLAKCGMGVNPVSGFLHDHLFVPVGREVEAVEALTVLAEESRRGVL